MSEPTCQEIDEYLSRKFDRWEVRDSYSGSGRVPVAFCGPSADPILGLAQRERIRLSLDYQPITHNWYSLTSPNGAFDGKGATPAEAAARAVYKMLKAKEKAND